MFYRFGYWLTTKQLTMATKLDYKKGVERYSPMHPSVQNCIFEVGANGFKTDGKYATSEEAEMEANLLDAIAHVGSANGLTANDYNHLFPAILRMLKSNSAWAK